MWPFTSGYPAQPLEALRRQYDYIVVGGTWYSFACSVIKKHLTPASGGTAGCVLARRVSEEQPDCTVLLVERGDASNMQVPIWCGRA